MVKEKEALGRRYEGEREVREAVGEKRVELMRKLDVGHGGGALAEGRDG